MRMIKRYDVYKIEYCCKHCNKPSNIITMMPTESKHGRFILYKDYTTSLKKLSKILHKTLNKWLKEYDNDILLKGGFSEARREFNNRLRKCLQ